MAAKKVWVTWIPKGKEAGGPERVLSSLQTYGMQVGGAPWVDDLEKMAWCDLGTALLETANVDLWLIVGSSDDFESKRVLYALSLVTAMVHEGRGHAFPIFCLGLDHLADAERMPMLTRGFHFLNETDNSWPAKIVASFLKKTGTEPPDFRLNAIGHPFIGQWFEIGPRNVEWEGAMFGVSPEGKITHHLVGPKGQLPEKSVLEYPIEGIKAEIRQVEYTAYAVQNRLGPEVSYFIKVDGYPSSVFFGGHPGTDKAEVTVIELTCIGK